MKVRIQGKSYDVICFSTETIEVDATNALGIATKKEVLKTIVWYCDKKERVPKKELMENVQNLE